MNNFSICYTSDVYRHSYRTRSEAQEINARRHLDLSSLKKLREAV